MMPSFLRRNIGYKILSLALGILLYTVVYAQRRPHVTREVFVQPEVVNVPEGMVVKSEPPGTRVTVSGEITAVEEYRNKRTKAVINLANATTGVNTVEISYTTDDPNLMVVGPERGQVVLEKRRQLPFAVDVLFDSSAPPGYVFTEPRVEPAKVTVSGLASDVSQVARVVAIANNADSSSAFSGMVDVVPQNIKGEAVDTVTVEPRSVTINIGIKKAPLTKAMVLSAAINGQPAAGYALTGYSFTPPVVTVRGTREQITDRSTINVPVDITGLNETTTRRVTVPLPTGMSMVEPASGAVTVRLEIRPINPVAATPEPAPTATPRPPERQPRPTPSPISKPPRSEEPPDDGGRAGDRRGADSQE
ncbi:MAG: hypothetical protein OHK0029_26210 [Armatimonadaceae bacterium]